MKIKASTIDEDFSPNRVAHGLHLLHCWRVLKSDWVMKIGE